MRRLRKVFDRMPTPTHWPRRAMLLAVLLGTTVLGAACRGNTQEEEVAEPVAPTWLVVQNRAFLDMNIYVYRSSQRVRLGMVNGNSTGKILIPANILFGSTPLRFQADPIGGNKKPVTQEISVSPGDEIQMIIPPA